MQLDIQSGSQNAIGRNGPERPTSSHRMCLPIPHELRSRLMALESTVRRARESRHLRSKLLGSNFYSGAPWEILLHLFESHLLQQRDTVGNLCDGVLSPATTAIRWIGRLEERGLISSMDDHFDSRRRYVSLTKAGTRTMNEYFDGLFIHGSLPDVA